MRCESETLRAYNAGAKAFDNGKDRLSRNVWTKEGGVSDLRSAWYRGWDTAKGYKRAAKQLPQPVGSE